MQHTVWLEEGVQQASYLPVAHGHMPMLLLHTAVLFLQKLSALGCSASC